MHVLVSGGAGFIGSHVVDSLLRDGHAVTVVDNFDPFYPRATKERNIARHRVHSGWRLVEADIRDLEHLHDALTGTYDAIIHLAAKAGVRPSLNDPLTYHDVNVRGTETLLEFARQKGIRQFVFASSSSVYGNNPRVPWQEEDHALEPISPYAASKVNGELLGHLYSHLHGIRFIALRFFTAYGPRQRPDLVVHKFARLMKAGRPIPVYGDGETRRDYTYVEDIVAGVRAALAYRRTWFEVFNVGNNHTLSLIEVIATLERALGIAATIEWLPEQPGDVPRTWADISKARALLDYAPQTRFADGVDRFAAWFEHASCDDRHREPVSLIANWLAAAHDLGQQRKAS